MLINVDAKKKYRAEWYRKNKDKHYAKQKEYRARVGIKSKYSYKYKQTNTVSYIYKAAKTRAKKKGLEFTIDKSDIIIPDICPYFGQKLTVDSIGYNPWFPSLDRIDSSKGYIKGNVEVISTLANRMKWDATAEQLIDFAKGVLRKVGKGPC